MAELGPPPPDGDRNRGSAVIATQVVTVSIAFALVCLRIWVRAGIVKHLGLDDFFIILGMICALIALGFNVAEVHYGLGRHSYYLSLSQQILIAKWLAVSEFAIITSEMFTKVSICFFLLRLFTTDKRRRWFIYSIILFVVATNSSSAAIALAQCRPTRKNWNPSIPGSCWGPHVQTVNGYYQGATSIFSDLLLAILPIVFLWDLKISFRVKVGICCLMGLGVFTAAATIVRMVWESVLKKDDITWNFVNITLWAVVEETIAIIAATIPTLRPFFRLVSDKFSTWSFLRFADRNDYNTHSEDKQRLHDLKPVKVSHPLELHFRSVLESQPNTLLTATRNESDTTSDRNTAVPTSEDQEGIRKTTEFTVSSMTNCQMQYHVSGI